LQVPEQQHQGLSWRSQASHSPYPRLPEHEDGRGYDQSIEVMRMIRRGHCLTCKPYAKDEVRFVNKLLDIYSSAA